MLRTTVEEPSRATDSTPPKMQFSLRTLLLMPLATGCAFAVLFAKPAAVCLLELNAAALLLPAVLATVIVYGSSSKRAFCIGALFPAGALCYFTVTTLIQFLLPLNWPVDSGILASYRWTFAAFWLASLIGGILCMGIRWMLDRPAAPVYSKSLRALGQAIFAVLLLVLVLGGPIIGQIGIAAGWWGTGIGMPVPTTASYANPYSSPPTYSSSTAAPVPVPYAPTVVAPSAPVQAPSGASGAPITPDNPAPPSPAGEGSR